MTDSFHWSFVLSLPFWRYNGQDANLRALQWRFTSICLLLQWEPIFSPRWRRWIEMSVGEMPFISLTRKNEQTRLPPSLSSALFEARACLIGWLLSPIPQSFVLSRHITDSWCWSHFVSTKNICICWFGARPIWIDSSVTVVLLMVLPIMVLFGC